LTPELASAMLDIWAARRAHRVRVWPDTLLVAAQRKLAWEASQIRPVTPPGVYRIHQQIREAL